jgi:hypothetical protein
MAQRIFIKLGTYIIQYEVASTAYFVYPVSNTTTAAFLMVLYYSLNCVYKLKFCCYCSKHLGLFEERKETVSFQNLSFRFIYTFACMCYITCLQQANLFGKFFKKNLILLPGTNSVTISDWNLDHWLIWILVFLLSVFIFLVIGMYLCFVAGPWLLTSARL